MKLSVKRNELVKATAKVNGLIPNRPIYPAMACFRLEADACNIKICGMSDAINGFAVCDATVNEPGVVVIPATKFTAIVSRMTADEVIMESIEESHLKLTCGSATVLLYGLKTDDFPQLPEWNEKEEIGVFNIDQAVLKEAIGMVNHSVSPDDYRIALTGVLFELVDNLLTLVATDGKRMATCSLLVDRTGEYHDSPNAQAVIPYGTIKEMTRWVDADTTVTVHLSPSKCMFEAGLWMLSGKVIDKKFPSYRGIIPTSYASTIELPRDVFKSRLQALTCLIPNGGKVTLAFGRKVLNLTASSTEIGEGKDSIETEYDGEEFSMDFNPEYLLGGLPTFPSNVIRFNVNSPDKAVVFTTEKLESGLEHLYLVMPMRKVSK